MRKLLFAVALAAAVAGSAWGATDPFDTARYDIGIKKNAEALAIVDSGQFDINTQTGEGYTLLHYAADANNLDMVRALLARGADPTIRSSLGSTPADMAIGTLVKAELVRAAAGWKGGPGKIATPVVAPAAPAPIPAAAPAPAMAPAPAPALASARPAGGNGMCAAVRAERVNDGRSLEMRPFLRARDNVWYNQPDELALLLQDCVSPDQRDSDGSTLLMVAAERNRVEAARVLLQHGANCAIASNSGDTALGLATSTEMKALLASCPRASAAPVAAGAELKKQCQQLFQAEAALCGDLSCRSRANRKWSKCLATGLFQ